MGDGYKMGDAGHGDMKAKRNMTVDHYSKWFLHMFMDADKSSPTYGQPVRFYGPYSGFAVYVSFNKTVPPAEVWDRPLLKSSRRRRCSTRTRAHSALFVFLSNEKLQISCILRRGIHFMKNWNDLMEMI